MLSKNVTRIRVRFVGRKSEAPSEIREILVGDNVDESTSDGACVLSDLLFLMIGMSAFINPDRPHRARCCRTAWTPKGQQTGLKPTVTRITKSFVCSRQVQIWRDGIFGGLGLHPHLAMGHPTTLGVALKTGVFESGNRP